MTTWTEVDQQGLEWKVTRIHRRPVISPAEVKRQREEARRKASGIKQPSEWMW